jgi:hypothetical protein
MPLAFVNGIHEVVGSIPISSTNENKGLGVILLSPSLSGQCFGQWWRENKEAGLFSPRRDPLGLPLVHKTPDPGIAEVAGPE